MKPKTMMLMVLAIGCGLGASYMTSQLLAERSQPLEQEKVTVLVAKKNLNIGTVLKDPQDLFVEKQYTRGEEPKEAVSSFEKLKDRQLKRSRRVGDWVSEEDLFGEGESGLQQHLPPGYRAVGIRVTPESIAHGFAALPHSRVDVFCTMRKNDKNPVATLLLEDVLVLAADSETGRDQESAPKLATVVTLALRPEEVAKIRLAEQMGPLSLALRGFDEGKLDRKVAANISDVYAGHTIHKDTSPKRVEPKKEQPQVNENSDKLESWVVAIRNGEKQEFWEYTRDEKQNVISCRQVDAASAPAPRPSKVGKGEAKGADKTASISPQDLVGTIWVGDESLEGYDRLEFRLRSATELSMIDAKETLEGTYRLNGNRIEMDFGGGVVYSGTLTGDTMGGSARNGERNWDWKVRRQ